LLVSIVAIVALLSCAAWAEPVEGSGVAKTEQRDVGEFKKVHVNGSTNVKVVIGAKRSVSVTTDDNLLPVIETVVKDGTLVIGAKQGFNTQLGVTVQITVPTLDAVAIHGSGDVEVKDLKAEKFKAEIQGSGDIRVAGRAEDLEVEIQGSGDVKLDHLAAKRASVEVQGSGDSTLNVSDELTVHLAGSGDVNYIGSPKVTKTGDASGDVKKVG
jgi:carbon monoxide dehydrogenase subunit G